MVNALGISSGAISSLTSSPWKRTRNWRNPNALTASSPRSTVLTVSTVTGVPYGIREARQAAAGRSQVGSPAIRESSRISALCSPASTSGALTLWLAAAFCPGR